VQAQLQWLFDNLKQDHGSAADFEKAYKFVSGLTRETERRL
jgi:hypothetical protein